MEGKDGLVMKKILKKITIFIIIVTFTSFYFTAIINTKNAFAFVVPSISGVVNAAGAMAEAGESLVEAGKVVGLSIPPGGPFGLATSVGQWLQGKSTVTCNVKIHRICAQKCTSNKS